MRRKRVLLVLPAPMMTRLWLSTTLGSLLGQDESIEVCVISPDDGDAETCGRLGMTWRPLLRLRDTRGLARLRFMASYVAHQMLAFRFNSIKGFRGFQERMRQSLGLRRIAAREGVAAFRAYGFPFPRSKMLYSLLNWIYVATQRYRPIEDIYRTWQPDLLVLSHTQNHFVTAYALEASSRKVPILGVVGSWDQPTTKGPIVPGLNHLLAQSEHIASELCRYHGVGRNDVSVVGWVQMDDYVNNPVTLDRESVLAQLGLPQDARYVLLGAYPERLGAHEPDLCRRLAAHLATQSAWLVVRPHPLDGAWEKRFGFLRDLPNAVVIAPEFQALERLKQQVIYAHATLSSGGTILLDAVALDRPAIGIAHEDEGVAHYDRVARRYDMEHWSAVIETGGIVLAKSDDALFAEVDRFLTDPSADAGARARLRNEHLAPLDGRAAQRIAAAVAHSSAQTGTAVRR